VPTKTLVERYFQGIETPSGRTWQFHGTINKVVNDTLKRKSYVDWVILLCKLKKPVSAYKFNPK
jgi:hypothetical protein